MRRFRSIVALIAAYALVLAAFMGALGTARAAMPDGFQLCRAVGSDEAPAPLRAEHELSCVLACGAGGQPMLAGSIAPLAISLGISVSVPAIFPIHRQFDRLSSAAPRGPPLPA